MKKTALGKAIKVVLGVTAMLGISTQASALTFTGGSVSISGSAPYKSWSDNGAENLGWAHTVSWQYLQIGSTDDINAGKTFDVKLNLEGSGTSSPMITGGFSIWTSGAEPLVFGGGFHKFNQVRGPNDGGITRNNVMHGTVGPFGGGQANNIIDGHNGWVGYAQNGATFTNADGDIVAHGGEANLASGVVSDYSVDVSNSTSLTLSGLAAGYYFLFVGGVCPNDLASCQPSATGGNNSREFTFAVSSVPLPAAAWLFGGAMASLGFSVKRKHRIQILS